MHNKGFTLIEVTIVLGLCAIIAAFALTTNFESYRASNLRATRGMLVSLLEHARAQAMSNVCVGALCAGGMAQGVHITSTDGIVTALALFQGSAYDAASTNNVPFAVNTNIYSTGLADISFAPLSGNAAQAGTLTLSDGTATSTITVGGEGQISWTN